MGEDKNKKTVEMTVEDVRRAANEQLNILYKKLQEANLANTFKRLDYLFKIVEGNFDTKMQDIARTEIDNIVLGKPEVAKDE